MKIPANHFRNIAHRLRYDDVDKFILKPAKTFDWENLSQNPVYASIHEKFINMNWMGIVHVNEKQVSESAVKEFYTGIHTDSKGNDLYVHFCGKEVIITTMTLGQALNIEWIKGDAEPPEDFDVNEAWKKLNGNDEIFLTLRSERRLVKDDVKMTLLFIRNNIWFDQIEEDYISDKKRVADMEAYKPSLICGFGHIVTTFGVRLRTKYHEHKDIKESCCTLALPSPQQQDNSNLEIMKMLYGIKDDIREITRSQNKLIKESQTWRKEAVEIMTLLLEKVTDKSFSFQPKKVKTTTAVVELSNSDEGTKSEEDTNGGKEMETMEPGDGIHWQLLCLGGFGPQDRLNWFHGCLFIIPATSTVKPIKRTCSRVIAIFYTVLRFLKHRMMKKCLCLGDVQVWKTNIYPLTWPVESISVLAFKDKMCLLLMRCRVNMEVARNL
ncbi:hypothetical protein COLO4_06581 [Corchorus olitorius]|uniref:Uncharacterized protein n=1 Tax=Corchorus olitorius TaxID=93759 RepID=A0A1R3KML3_9ROSI|nr:hypothetical protein COLO4_06581 [Corchorus olitorius]